jgi:hypothetical protein
VGVESGMQYRDEGCERIEEALRARSEYAGWSAHRMSLGKTLTKRSPELTDPYEIENEKKKSIIWIGEKELELLDSPELLLAYIEVEIQRERISGKYCEFSLFYLLFSLLFDMMLVPYLKFWMFPLLVVIFVPVILLEKIYRANKIEREQIELDILHARNNPAYREAIRRLSGLSDNLKPDADDFQKFGERYRVIEDALTHE